ncbi:Tfx family DNA-binding protein [Candidatus Bathyarchaeota archaeon]|nr:Tfx family DNA-binding protein [Candidatus Bathyarchaeota archaeon]
MVRRRYGLLTPTQFEVLRLRLEGLSQEEVAERLGTTRQNISIIERRAKRNLRLAEETLRAYRELVAASSVEVPPETHLVDIPRMVIDAADEAGVKLRANFTRIYDEIRFKAGKCVRGVKTIKPLKILIFKDGDIEVIPEA